MGRLATFYLSQGELLAYQVIARKWRPQNFSELVGQNHVTQTLLNALKNHRLHHALLLTGPRGTGKTSSARILAKAVRCPNSTDFVPCGVCKECVDIALGRALDVIEIDGASNNGVDSVRELIDRVGYMPSSGTRKVYIIDEVHMLSTAAFNALLKTLEEPPEHVLFIMATTEVHKIPATILSRCQRFDFRRISTQLVTEQLAKICEAEKINANKDALWLIARQGEGSMRDSLSLLDQVITFADSEITLTQTLDVLGLTDRRLLTETVEALATRDVNRVLSICDRISDGGFDARIFIQDLLESLRNLLFLRLSPQAQLDLPESEIKVLIEVSKGLGHEDIHLLFDMALKGAQDLVRSTDTKIVLEMLLLRMAEAPRVQDIMRMSEKPKTKKTVEVKTVAPPVEVVQKKKGPVTLPEKWLDLVEKIKAVNPLVGAKLENSFLKTMDEQKLVIGIPPKLKFLYEQVQDVNFQKKLQNYLTTFWGPGHSLQFQLGDGEVEATPKNLEEQRAQKERAEIRLQVENHPLVKSTQQLFKSEIKNIKEIKS